MKSFAALLCSILLTCCTDKKPVTKSSGPDTVVYYPYEPVYTSGYEKGNPLYAKEVLTIWKEWETGDVKHRSESFADSLRLILPNTIVNGKRDSVLSVFGKRRKAYTDVQCYIDSWMPVKAKDNGEELVLLWGRQDCTNGKKRDYLVLHEIWTFNKQGKIKQLVQYLTSPF